MRLGMVMPLWWQQNPKVIDYTLRNVALLDTAHVARLFVVANRLPDGTNTDVLQQRIQDKCRYPVELLHDPYNEKSVSGAWNWGCRTALDWGADRYLILANDVSVRPEAIDKLVDYAQRQQNKLDLVSGSPQQYTNNDCLEMLPADFCFFTLTKKTLDRFGTFDERFYPAYYEDRDYAARIMAGGGRLLRYSHATCLHAVSSTIKEEAAARHQSQQRFERNRLRYLRKWGYELEYRSDVPVVGRGTRNDLLKPIFSHPWNDSRLPVSFWDRD